MKLEAAILAVAMIATVSACVAYLPRAIDAEQSNQRRISHGYHDYQTFVKRNDGTKIHIVRNEP